MDASDAYDKVLTACKSIDKRGKGKTVLAADYKAIHEGLPAMPIKLPRTFVNTPTASGTIRWRPGHGIGSGEVSRVGNTRLTQQTAEMDAAVGYPIFKHYKPIIAWALLEPTKNNYDFSHLDALFALASARGLKLCPEIWHTKFATNPTDYIPSYLSSEPSSSGGWRVGSYSTTANIDLASIMDRYIALFQAIAAAYNNEPLLENIGFGETSNEVVGTYSGDNHATQLLRLFPAMKAAFTKCTWNQGVNWMPKYSQVLSVVQGLYANGLGISTPDTMGYSALNYTDSAGLSTGQRVYIGQIWTGNPNVFPGGTVGDISLWTSGGTDYRGLMPAAFQVEEPEMLGYQFGNMGSPFALSDIRQMSNDVLHNNHTMWSYPSSQPSFWPTIRDYLHTNQPLVYTGCPGSYGGACAV